MPDKEIEQHRYATMFSTLTNHGLRAHGEFVGLVCPCCHRFRRVERRRLNTAYNDDERNFMVSCDFCYEDAVEHYKDLWEDYYRNVM